MTDEAMDQIRHARDLIAGQQWEELDALLASDLTPLPSPRLVGPLLATLVDDVAAEPHLFGVIHLAETADDSDYVAGLLEALPRLTQASPRWARILLVRVLNSPAALAGLIAAAPHAPEPQQAAAPEPQQAAVALAAESVKTWRPDQFGERCAQVRGALSLSD